MSNAIETRGSNLCQVLTAAIDLARQFPEKFAVSIMDEPDSKEVKARTNLVQSGVITEMVLEITGESKELNQQLKLVQNGVIVYRLDQTSGCTTQNRWEGLSHLANNLSPESALSISEMLKKYEVDNIGQAIEWSDHWAETSISPNNALRIIGSGILALPILHRGETSLDKLTRAKIMLAG
jgi:hypothetical protein